MHLLKCIVGYSVQHGEIYVALITLISGILDFKCLLFNLNCSLLDLTCLTLGLDTLTCLEGKEEVIIFSNISGK